MYPNIAYAYVLQYANLGFPAPIEVFYSKATAGQGIASYLQHRIPEKDKEKAQLILNEYKNVDIELLAEKAQRGELSRWLHLSEAQAIM